MMSPVEPFAIFVTASPFAFFHPPKVKPVFVASESVISSVTV